MRVRIWIAGIVAFAAVIAVLAAVSFHFGKEAAKRKEAADAAKESSTHPPHGTFAPDLPAEFPSRHVSPPPPPPLPAPASSGAQPNADAAAKLDLPFTDPTGRYDLRIRRILVGDDCWYKNVISEEELTGIHDQNKEAVYFEVSVGNLAVYQGIDVTSGDFFLNDDAGQWYRSDLAARSPHAHLSVGGKASVGALFHMYTGNYPVRLLYRTGYVSASTGKEIYAYADRLDTLEALNRLIPYFAESQAPEPDGRQEEEARETPAETGTGSPAALPDGFRGVRWGTRIDTVDGLVYAPGHDVAYRELKAYKQAADETFYFDTIELRDSTYFSNRDVLVGGSAAFDCRDSQIALKVLKERYGPGGEVSGNPDAPRFMRWEGKETNLEYHHWEGACHLFFKSAISWRPSAEPVPPPAEEEAPSQNEENPPQVQ